jgi:cytidyltransferase-like protein
MDIVVVSGGFDPIHSGHITYLESAKKLGEKLIIALNSDDWLIKKKGSFLMPFEERKLILENLVFVDTVVNFDDDEEGSAINALTKVKEMYPSDNIIFANGGDRTRDNIPEMSLAGIDFRFGIGGDNKMNSSSWILKKWKNYNEDRKWGSFINLLHEKNVKVKELIINPGKYTSFQRHFNRSEIWLISKGSCQILHSENQVEDRKKLQLNTFDHYVAPVGQWHQITNPFDNPCHIIEIQYGESCDEDDIERLQLD